MKKNKKIISTSMLALMIIAGNQSILASAQSVVPSQPAPTTSSTTSGTCGSAPWNLNNGVLTIHSGVLAHTAVTDGTTNISPWADISSQITKIIIEPGVVASQNSLGLFAGMSNLTEIDGLVNLDTSNVTNMAFMFADTPNLTQINGLDHLDTNNVTNMAFMFARAYKLNALDLSNFKTNKVVKMNGMFSEMYSLTNLDLSNFNTSNVINMNGMFDDAESLTNLDLSKFDTSKVTDMGGLFQGTKSLQSLNISNFDMDNVKDTTDIFNDMPKLNFLAIPLAFQISSVPGNVKIKIGQSEIKVHDSTIYVGDTWNRANNFTSAKTKDGTALAIGDITVTGKVDTTKAGTYDVHYVYEGLDEKATITVVAKSNKPSSTTDSSSTKPSTSNKPGTTNQSTVQYQAVYRLYNKNTGEHFYTESAFEKDSLVKSGWNSEGIGWSAPSKGTAVYRVYNPNAKGGDHYYTTSQYEAQSLVKAGWKWDNGAKPAFYSGGKTPVYVAFNPNATASGSHNYTSSSFEQNSLLKIGWKYGKVQLYSK